MHWGHKYEPVSVQLYEYLYKTAVSDFGCIPHATLDFLAASPDGINTLETSDRYGSMLEIKNIVNRDIDGVPKMEYWIQMQLQLEVCNLNECDFLETRFKEYADEEAYLLDSYVEGECEHDINKTQEGQQKGMMIQFIVHGQPFYEYAPLNATKAELTAWEAVMMEKHHNHMWCKNIYWWLDELSCVLVLRNKFWFKAAVPILTDLWKTIEHEKTHGYEHRSPNKKVKMDSAPNGLSGKCLIDLSEMMDMAMDENENEHNSEVTLDTNKVFTFEPKPHNSETKVLKLDTNVLTLDTNVLTIDTEIG